MKQHYSADVFFQLKTLKWNLNQLGEFSLTLNWEFNEAITDLGLPIIPILNIHFQFPIPDNIKAWCF